MFIQATIKIYLYFPLLYHKKCYIRNIVLHLGFSPNDISYQSFPINGEGASLLLYEAR